MIVCLVIPPSPFLLDERVFMSLGVLKVAAALEQAGHTVQVLDLSGVSNFTLAVQEYCETFDTLSFGITATTPQLPAATQIATTIRHSQPAAKIILGGPHSTLVNAARRREVIAGTPGRACMAFDTLWEHFDVLVTGDGEDAVIPALTAPTRTHIDADNPISPYFLTNQRLDALSFPARHLVDVDSYHYFIDGIRALNMIAQLGCPFECGFCGGWYSPFFRRVRTRTSENIVTEMVHIYQTYGIRGFMMYDDELNVNRRMIELMDLVFKTQTKLGTEFRLRGFIKAELLTEEQAGAMYRAGFRWILIGFESGSPRILKNMNKKATLEQNTRCLEIARKYGLRVKALMSVGHPGESPETIEETRNWLIGSGPDDFDVSIITTYPGTPYYDLARPHESTPDHWTYTFEHTGDRLHSIDIDYSTILNYYKGRPGGYQSFVYTDYLTPNELVAQRDRVEQTVRAALDIPYNPSAPTFRYEHPIGQHGLPTTILHAPRIK